MFGRREDVWENAFDLLEDEFVRGWSPCNCGCSP
jgi:hypothetical protein